MFQKKKWEISWAQSFPLVQEDQSELGQQNHKQNHKLFEFPLNLNIHVYKRKFSDEN